MIALMGGQQMNRLLKNVLVVAINLIVFVAILGSIELYYRVNYPYKPQYPDNNGLWQKFLPYVEIGTAPGKYLQWKNNFTGKTYQADVKTNSLGFNESRELSYTEPYKKAANERVVLFTGGSTAWGVGATATDKTIAGRMQFYLNSLQHDIKYTVVNLGMGSWIAYQQFIALELWGEVFQPDWVVVMDGHNDADVGCGFGQGVGNPMYHATIQSFVDGYLYSTQRPTFYRGWFENELIKHSAAYRTISGKDYVQQSQHFDETSTEANPTRRQIIPTKVGESRAILDFYLKSERAILNLYPEASYILSTQPLVNIFSGDFVNIYDFAVGSEAREAAIAKREKELEDHLKYHENEWCSQKTGPPSKTYIFGNGAVKVERLVEEARVRGRNVEYHNIGTLFPNEREKRIPYFITGVHLLDEGMDVIGKFYAERILASDATHRHPVKPANSENTAASDESIPGGVRLHNSLVAPIMGVLPADPANATAADGFSFQEWNFKPKISGAIVQVRVTAYASASEPNVAVVAAFLKGQRAPIALASKEVSNNERVEIELKADIPIDGSKPVPLDFRIGPDKPGFIVLNGPEGTASPVETVITITE
jgi:hypothetical protein